MYYNNSKYHDSMKMDSCREFSHRLKLGMAPVLALLHRQEMSNQALFIIQELITFAILN